jgi:hypothetical protein
MAFDQLSVTEFFAVPVRLQSSRDSGLLIINAFEPEEMADFLEEMHSNGLHSGVLPCSESSIPIGNLTDQLLANNNPYSAKVLKTLGSIATHLDPKATNFTYDHTLISEGINAHHHGSFGIRLVLVASGSVAYTFGGWAPFFMHRGGAKRQADTGDVLAMNDNHPIRLYKPLHSSKNGTGTRVSMDFSQS